MQRLDVGELAELIPIAPGKEPGHGVVIGGPRVLVANGGGEEFEKAAGGMLAGVGDHARHQDQARVRRHGLQFGGHHGL
jgi:hypothetical protein